MANRTLRDLPATTTVADADLFHLSQSNIDKKVAASVVSGYVFDEIDDLTQQTTLNSTDDFVIREQGAPNVSKRTAASVVKQFCNYGSVTVNDTDYTVSDSEVSLTYIVFPTTESRIFTLPSLASNNGKLIRIIKGSNAYYPVVVRRASTDLINGLWIDAALFKQGETIELFGDTANNRWLVVNNWRWQIESGWISRSLYQNKHLGTIDLIYTGLTGTYSRWESVIESTSGFRGIVAFDTGSILRLWYIDDGSGGVGGFFTNGRTITGESSGATSTVNGNTKNIDSNAYHGLSLNLRNIMQKIFLSSDGSEGNCFEVTNHINRTDSGADEGTVNFQVDTTNTKVQTGQSGTRQMNDAGVTINIANTDQFYNLTLSNI